MERLNKVLAHSNIASRRKSETLILEGRVKVNGLVVTDLGFKVDPKEKIEVAGHGIEPITPVYYLLNKPTGFVSTTSDEKGRKTVLDLLNLQDRKTRLYPVGRLDFDTAGLLLLTNDGDFTQKMTRPEHQIEKEYLVRVSGIVIRKKIVELRKGIMIDDGFLAIPKAVHLLELDKINKTTLLSVTLTEGKNKQVRKMMEAMGHPVKKLTRIRYDFLTLEGVERGTYRPLKVHEVRKLVGHAHQKTAKPTAKTI